MTSDLTMGSFRGAYYESKLMPRIGLEEWEQRNQPTFDGLLREQTRELLEDHSPLDDHDDLIARGESFIKALEGC